MNEKKRPKNCPGVKVVYATVQGAVFFGHFCFMENLSKRLFLPAARFFQKSAIIFLSFSEFLCAAFCRRMLKFLCPKGGKAVRFASQYAHDAPVS
ncbi:MAG: hypothetical protein J5556_02840 [Deltaproteobacteria bacterium]|nr:hypothetical protein [Deltaproteobacteria bacterium]